MTDSPSGSPSQEPLHQIDDSVPQSARIWNYLLGGRDNYMVDREVGDQFREAYPPIVDIAREQRYFLARVVRFMAGEAGIRQFLDIGTGLPTVDNTHEIAQRVAPAARIVYVDNDPLVLMHARALLTSHPEGVTRYVDADLHDPDAIVRGAAETLDFSQPVGVTMMGILGHVSDYAEAKSIVKRLLDVVPSGSYLAIADGLSGIKPFDDAMAIWNEHAEPRYTLRSVQQITGYFDGLDLLEPGVVPNPLWRPDPNPFEPPAELENVGGVGRKR